MSRQKDNKFLTTFKTWDFSEFIKSFDNKAIPICAIFIDSYLDKIGHQEEKGNWVNKFWKDITSNNSSIEGIRSGWSELIFLSRKMDSKDFKEYFIKLLKENLDKNIKSIAIFSQVEGSFENKIEEIEKMTLQLNKINYWKEHLYKIYYENGEEKILKKN